MNLDRQQALQYLRASPDDPWQWAEHGQEVVWHDGTTIAFKAELEKIFEHLAPHLSNSLPPFGAVVVLLAAARGKLPPKPEIPPPSGIDDAGRAALQGGLRWRVQSMFKTALEQLQRIASLPAELRSGLKARCLLVEVAFENTRGDKHIDAAQILRGMAIPFSNEALDPDTGYRAESTLLRDVELVARGLEPHTVDSLTLRLRTGLDALPEDSGPALPPAEKARRLIAELSRDAEFGPIARAARDLLAAVRLPRRLLQTDELPLGGVSDITNRGPLDRLLLSELAHDDLTLSVRVALNEALYLRREPPMHEPPGTLAILLDSGVRLWGVPRVLATAAAMALIAQDRHGTQLLAWRADGARIHEADLLSREGLTRHLEALATEAHPGHSLPAFAQALPAGAASQSVVITHRDALEDPEFRLALSAQADAIAFVATVTREGQFELHTVPLARRPPVCQAELDLDAVFSPKTGGPPLRVEIDPNLPAIFGVRPFPFLLPLSGRLEISSQARDGIIHGVLQDRRLVEFRKPDAGGRILAADLPAGATRWIETVDGVIHFLKAGTTHRPLRLVSFPLPGGPIQIVELHEVPQVEAIHRYGEVLILAGQHRVQACSLVTGQVLARRVNPHKTLHGRFLRGSQHFFAIVWDGNEIQFDEIALPKSAPFDRVVCLFDRDGEEGPWFVTRDGIIGTTTGDARVDIRSSAFPLNAIRDAAPSCDGHLLFIRDGGWVYRWDIKAGTGQRIFREKRFQAPELRHQPQLPNWTVFRAIDAVAPLDDGLALRGKNGHWRNLALKDGRLLIASLDKTEIGPTRGQQVPVIPAEGDPRRPWTLNPLEWPDGSRAWLDSRGLLHLRSSDTTVPEISIVLADKKVAAWTSDGHRCGPQFFFEGPIVQDHHVIADYLRRFVRAIA